MIEVSQLGQYTCPVLVGRDYDRPCTLTMERYFFESRIKFVPTKWDSDNIINNFVIIFLTIFQKYKVYIEVKW